MDFSTGLEKTNSPQHFQPADLPCEAVLLRPGTVARNEIEADLTACHIFRRDEIGGQAVEPPRVALHPTPYPHERVLEDLLPGTAPEGAGQRIVLDDAGVSILTVPAARGDLERKFHSFRRAPAEMEMQMAGDRGAGADTVEIADMARQAVGEIEQCGDQVTAAPCASGAENPFLRAVLGAGDNDMHRQQRKRVHPDQEGLAGEFDLVAQLGTMLLPPNIVAAQKATIVGGDGSRRRDRPAGAAEPQRPPSDCTGREKISPGRPAAGRGGPRHPLGRH